MSLWSLLPGPVSPPDLGSLEGARTQTPPRPAPSLVCAPTLNVAGAVTAPHSLPLHVRSPRMLVSCTQLPLSRATDASQHSETSTRLTSCPRSPQAPPSQAPLSPGSDAKLVEFPSLLPASRGRCLGGHPESAHFSRARPPQCSRRVPAGTAGRPPMTLFPPRAGRVLHPAGRAQVTAPWFYTCPSQNLRTRLWK